MKLSVLIDLMWLGLQTHCAISKESIFDRGKEMQTIVLFRKGPKKDNGGHIKVCQVGTQSVVSKKLALDDSSKRMFRVERKFVKKLKGISSFKVNQGL